MVVLNDIHGSTSNIDSFITGCDVFFGENKEGSNWTVSGGDMFIKGAANNPIVARFIDKYVDVSAVGNHDIANAQNFSELIEKHGIAHKFLSANMKASEGSPLDGKIARSIIVEDGSQKLGFIGVSPFDFDSHISRNETNEFVSVNDLKTTVKAIKQEVRSLESQGVDKIILLAHTGQSSEEIKGIDYYKVFAKIGGIDVIVGGHDHLMVDKWEKSSRRSVDNPEEFEPVKVFSTGEDYLHYFGGNLNMFGTMNLTFDDNGVLIPNECKNDIRYTHIYPATNFVSKFIDKNARKIVGVLNMPIVTLSNPLRTENKVANFVADSDFWYATRNSQIGPKPDFAMINAGTVRDEFSHVEISRNDIHQVLPFKESLVKVELTKKQIYDALSIAAESTTLKKPTPGLMQVSHLSYKVNPDYSVSQVKILDDAGRVRYDLDKMDDDDKFTCVTDSFLISGPNLLKCLKTEAIEDYGVTRAEALEEFLSSREPKNALLSDRINMPK